MLDKGLRPSPAIADGRKEKVISVVPSRSYLRGNMVSFGIWGGEGKDQTFAADHQCCSCVSKALRLPEL